MDEALHKIEKILAEQRQPSRIDPILPRKTAVAKTDAAIDIAHYGKVSAGEQAPVPVKEEIVVESPAPKPKPEYVDPAAKIGVGAREFNLDELSSEAMGGEVSPDVASKIGTGGRVFKLDDLSGEQGSDPLMGNVFKPSNSRELSLDELSSEPEEK
ncbi:MAG: hypothetical protein KJ620_10180 [Candidatus Edwardsbacteria bacterium]|nr:hypothetical protein [Candidatus Edwardsbacteria bacterium]MBU1577430.1 hypothetical protein [Candidatus Edwardsbacteria bacterium]MBU2463236.1 hypothetical protein [Candidatus Edwardsbacteria bacterium]MBU2592997.1 hypothetical protein [Candidatus Edwardsbacteria bacterium]